jgi:hypothetical protein
MASKARSKAETFTLRVLGSICLLAAVATAIWGSAIGSLVAVPYTGLLLLGAFKFCEIPGANTLVDLISAFRKQGSTVENNSESRRSTQGDLFDQNPNIVHFQSANEAR